MFESHIYWGLKRLLYMLNTYCEKLINWVVFPPPLLSFSASKLFTDPRHVELVSPCIIQVSQRFNSTKYCTSSHPPSPTSPFLIGSHLCILGDPERPVSPWAGRPRGSGSPCADSGSVNRADGFWQIHSVWKSFILQDFFSSLFHEHPHLPPCTKRAVHRPSD